MLTTPGRDGALSSITGSRFIGLLTAITNWRTPTVTETTYAGYSATRPSITFGAAADTSPAGGRVVANSGIVTFGEKTDAGSVSIIAAGIYSASSGGVLHEIIPCSNGNPKFAVGETVSEDLYCPAHGLTTDDRVYLLANSGAELPAGLSENVLYFVLAAGLTTDKLRVALTSGGAAINITAGGACIIIKSVPVTVAQFATPSFAVSAFAVAL